MAGDWRVVQGDCVGQMRLLEADSVDSIVTDPPYGINFMGKVWDHQAIQEAAIRRAAGTQNLPGRTRPRLAPAEEAGKYDLSPTANRRFQDWTEAWAMEAFRVLKPGGFLLSFCSTRTSHRMTSGIEDAGFEVRDTIHWTFGSGFPKSLNLDGAGKGWGTALKPAHEHICVARKPINGTVQGNFERHGTGALNIEACRVATVAPRPGRDRDPNPAIDDSRVAYRDGLGGSRAVEDTMQGRWPPNVLLTHSPECRRVGTKRVKSTAAHPIYSTTKPEGWGTVTQKHGEVVNYGGPDGLEVVEAWECVPGCPVKLLDAQSGHLKSGDVRDGILRRGTDKTRLVYGSFAAQDVETPPIYADEGGASRFYPVLDWQPDDTEWVPFIYEAKASRSEREDGCDDLPARHGHEAVDREAGTKGLQNPRAGAGRTAALVRNHHPTVKPIALMEWLVQLVTPKGGLVLDPFTGSGTTGCAAVRNGYRFIGFELDADYVRIARARIKYHAQPFDAMGQPRPERSLAAFMAEQEDQA